MPTILVVNAGSSSLKSTVFGPGDVERSADAAWAADRVRQLRDAFPSTVDAIGHRIVHGGPTLRASVLLDAAARAELGRVAALDPLHMTPALAAIDAAAAAFPGVPQVAAFDTTFHATMPASAGYAVPYEWIERYDARRYGFHGLSVDWAVSHVPPAARTVVCHLGNGSSVTAVCEGRSVDTTMGFTPLEGVVMGTRAGTVDPGLLLRLLLHHGLSASDVREALESRSGLLGLSGVSADLRHVLAAADAQNPRAVLAYDTFVRSVRRAIGAMCGVLGGIDSLVFTGGIGEHSPRARADVAGAVPGLVLDDTAVDGRVSTATSAVPAYVVHAREDRVVLREVLRLLG